MAERCCVVYVRVSTEEQARHGYSLAAQVRECRERALALGYLEPAITVLVDEGYSGDAVGRPGLTRLRDLVAQPGRVGHVVILDPDRFARSLSLQLVVTEEIIRGGAVLEFLNFAWQDGPEGKLFYSLRGAIAEYEKAKIRERTRRGREQKARQGLLPVGKSLYGYRYNPASGALEPVEAERAVLRLMRDLMLAGAPDTGGPLSAVQTARWLAGRGVPAPGGGRWYSSTVARMMRSEAYTGIYRVLGRRYAIELPEPLWDAATHGALCARLEAGRLSPGRRRSGEPYLLTGLLRCGLCGRRMRGHAVKDRRRDYRYYLCRHTAAFEVPTGRQVRCTGRHWPAGLLDGAVWQAVRERLAVVPAGGLPDAAEQHRTEREALAHALRQRLSEEERYLRLFAAGHITAEERLRRLLEPVRAAVASLRERLLALERSGWACGRPGAQTPDRTGEGMTGRPELNALPAGVRRELVRLLVREAVVGEGGLLIHVIPNPDRQLGR